MFKYVSKKSKDLKNYSKEISQFDKILEESQEIKNMASSLFNHKEKIEAAKVETFKEAQERNGLSNADIVEKMYEMNKMFYVCLYCIYPVLILLIYFIIKLNFLSAMITLVVIGILGANAFKFSFRYFQFKHKSLCPVSDWVHARSEWIPKRMSEKQMFKLKNQESLKDKEEYEKFLKHLEEDRKKRALLSQQTYDFYESLKKNREEFNVVKKENEKNNS